MDRYVVREECFLDFPIRCQVTGLDQGLHVLLTGGSQTHIGAISTCLPGTLPETKVFPGHKDQFVSEPWAKALAQRFQVPVCVVCGIHYDHLNREQIGELLDLTNRMLCRLIT